MIDLFNAVCSFAIFLVAGCLVLDPRVNDGFIIKVGLVLCALAHLCLTFLYIERPPTWSALSAARALVHLSILIMVAGYYVRVWRDGHKQRRKSDWMKLEGDST